MRTLKTLNTNFQFGKRALTAKILIEYDFDSLHGIVEDGLDQDIIKAINENKLNSMLVKVTATFGSVSAFDTLGNVLTHNDSRESGDILDAVRDHDMIDEVLNKLKSELSKLVHMLGV